MSHPFSILISCRHSMLSLSLPSISDREITLTHSDSFFLFPLFSLLSLHALSPLHANTDSIRRKSTPNLAITAHHHLATTCTCSWFSLSLSVSVTVCGNKRLCRETSDQERIDSCCRGCRCTSCSSFLLLCCCCCRRRCRCCCRRRRHLRLPVTVAGCQRQGIRVSKTGSPIDQLHPLPPRHRLTESSTTADADAGLLTPIPVLSPLLLLVNARRSSLPSGRNAASDS